MSLTLAFWKGPHTADDTAVYLALGDVPVPHVEPVDVDGVLAAVKAGFSEWSQSSNMWELADEHGRILEAFDLEIRGQLVQFTCYGLTVDHLNRIMDVMNGMGFPLYDPQTRERFAV